MNRYDLIVIGGGAAGFFGALACAEAAAKARVLILEATPRLLTKVKVSGGGRCNVTHHCFEPKELIKNYPRGSKELLGAFHRFGPQDTINWFAAHGVTLKAEADGRMFPVSDSSQTIIDCLTDTCRQAGVTIQTKALVHRIERSADGFQIILRSGDVLESAHLLLATGSMSVGWELARGLGHQLVAPVPSLFTFEMEDPLLKDLPGVSFAQAKLQLQVGGADGASAFVQTGALLITHWGLSGPAVLKLSAFAARELFAAEYQAKLIVNFEGASTAAAFAERLQQSKQDNAKKKLGTVNPLQGPRRFWEAVLQNLGVSADKLWADLSKKELLRIAEQVTAWPFAITGKGVFKEEFVTAGGVSRSEVDFKNFESKLVPGLFFAGEVLDIDGITGGFNFQNAWTASYLAGRTVAGRLL